MKLSVQAGLRTSGSVRRALQILDAAGPVTAVQSVALFTHGQVLPLGLLTTL